LSHHFNPTYLVVVQELQEKREKALQGSLAKRSEQRLVDLSKYSNS